MCVFFATLAGTGPFSFALDLISISFAAARHFTGIPLSMDQLFFYFRGGLLQGPGAVFRNRTTHHTASLKKFLAWNEPFADAKGARPDLHSLSTGPLHASSHAVASA